MEMVLADGSVVRADDSENSDLFWAVRGAGANFGIVTAFEFEADDVGAVAFARLAQDASDDPPVFHGEPVSRSGLLRHVTPRFAAAAARVIRSGAIGWFQLRSVGGAVADVPSGATAYAHRDANFSLVVMGGADKVVDRAWAQLSPFLDGLYISFDSSLRPERIAEAWPHGPSRVCGS
ncbi:hypothetical protein [Streptomyces hainanensis]|uniref:hypothetical protein n=1 Tax=Streptomyces hainanensis TaxID=402648 RepID=UPI001FB6661B|nr:hypothetical protein [Streptomyces hainanensis]